MDLRDILLEKLKAYGVGRRKLDDDFFAEGKPPRLGIYDVDDEALCHEVIKTSCPSCSFTAESLLQFESHYNSTHRYSCGQCKKVLPTQHILDLHVQERHDSYFAVMATRKPSYCCYIEECKEKFMNPEERLEHCVKTHKLPKDFRYYQQRKLHKKRKENKKKPTNSMECDNDKDSHKNSSNKFAFSNSKLKTFPKYTGKTFTTDNKDSQERNIEVNMDCIVDELRDSLPQ